MSLPDHSSLILLVAVLAGLVQGLAGFGSALVALPLLALMLPVQTVVPLMALTGVALSAFNLLHLHQSVRVAPILPLLGGYLIGTPIGLLLLSRAPAPVVLGLLGLTISGYALFAMAGRQPERGWLREQRFAIGTVSGALGAAFSTNGPPVILHVAAHRDWDADRQKAALTLFFLVSGAITAAAHAASGLVTREILALWLLCLPALLGGTLVGIGLYRKLGAHDYRRLVYALVLVTGMVLALRAGYGMLA